MNGGLRAIDGIRACRLPEKPSLRDLLSKLGTDIHLYHDSHGALTTDKLFGRIELELAYSSHGTILHTGLLSL